MTIAFTIGSYQLFQFVYLGLKQLQELSPESPVLVSDDRSNASEQIEAVAHECGAAFECSKVRRGHFAGDFQSLVSALAFAQAVDADIAVKVSQRFVFRKRDAIDAIKKAFEDEKIAAATPGRPSVVFNTGTKKGGTFNAFSMLSDVVCIRAKELKPEQLLHLYRQRLMRERTPWASFIECTVDELHSHVFPGRTVKIAEITDPQPDPWYLRRYQARQDQYRELATRHGIGGHFDLVEWALIEKHGYQPRPLVV